MVLESTGSSKANNIRSLLIRAWRERWTDVQWGTHIKTVLPRYISGDIYHLSDCILQQALLGPLPNQLILSYLRHSLAAHLVSYGGVIESISKYDPLVKSHCVRALLDLLSDISNKITCRGKPEDCLALATALVSGIKWVLKVAFYASCRTQVRDQIANLRKSVEILQSYLKCSFSVGLLHIARLEDQELWASLLSVVADVEGKVNSVAALAEFREGFTAVFNELRNTDFTRSLVTSHKFDSKQFPMCYGLHARVLVEAIMHPTQSSHVLAYQLVLYQQLRGLSEKDLYLELLVTCFYGLGSDEKFPYQHTHWVGFTFVKAPSIILLIHNTLHGSSTASGPSLSHNLRHAVRELSQRTTLLDFADNRSNCNCLEHLLHELTVRTSLLLERDASAILAERKSDPRAVCIGAASDTASAAASPIVSPNLILRALTTVNSILKTLCNKDLNSVLSVMNLLISGKSKEFMLTAAAATGQLPTTAHEFVRFHQMSMEPQPGENEQMATNRALMFDITFLLLCHIAQIYGTEVVTIDSSESFVESFLKSLMPEDGLIKSVPPEWRVDHAGLNDAYNQIMANDFLSKYVNVNFNSICSISSLLIQRLAREVCDDELSLQGASEFIDKACGHLCSLPIIFMAWLCSYVHEVSGASAVKINALIDHLQHKLVKYEPQISFGSFKDRSLLMTDIINNMAKVARIKKEGKQHEEDRDALQSGYHFSHFLGEVFRLPKEPEVPQTQVLDEELKEVWDKMFKKNGAMNHASAYELDRLLRLGGPKWFVFGLVQRAMMSVFESDLSRALDLVYGAVQLKLHLCCLTLLNDTFPFYLEMTGRAALNSHRRIYALARLLVQVLVAAWASVAPLPPSQVALASQVSIPPQDTSGAFPAAFSRKRSYSMMAEEEMEETLLKQISVLTVDKNSFKEVGQSGLAIMIAFQGLLTKLCKAVSLGVLSPVSELVVAILKELVAAPNVVSPLMHLLPANILSLLMALHPPDTFSPEQLLALALPPPYAGLPSPLTPAQEAAARRSAAKVLCTHRNFKLSAD